MTAHKSGPVSEKQAFTAQTCVRSDFFQHKPTFKTPYPISFVHLLWAILCSKHFTTNCWPCFSSVFQPSKFHSHPMVLLPLKCLFQFNRFHCCPMLLAAAHTSTSSAIIVPFSSKCPSDNSFTCMFFGHCVLMLSKL